VVNQFAGRLFFGQDKIGGSCAGDIGNRKEIEKGQRFWAVTPHGMPKNLRLEAGEDLHGVHGQVVEAAGEDADEQHSDGGGTRFLPEGLGAGAQ
jgi:hypothetical protein